MNSPLRAYIIALMASGILLSLAGTVALATSLSTLPWAAIPAVICAVFTYRLVLDLKSL